MYAGVFLGSGDAGCFVWVLLEDGCVPLDTQTRDVPCGDVRGVREVGLWSFWPARC